MIQTLHDTLKAPEKVFDYLNLVDNSQLIDSVSSLIFVAAKDA